jgi:hypothetical protein
MARVTERDGSLRRAAASRSVTVVTVRDGHPPSRREGGVTPASRHADAEPEPIDDLIDAWLDAPAKPKAGR